MPIEVKLVGSETDVAKVSSVLLQLRTGYDEPALCARIDEQRARGYQLAYVEIDGRVLCVAGFVIGTKLAWGRHLYVDDLVTVESRRGSGAGAHLVAWLKEYARANGCRQIHLDSGVTNFAAHRFYLRQGFDIASHHFVIKELAG